MTRKAAIGAGVICVLTVALVSGQSANKPATLPDWSGAWVLDGPTVFDRATVQPTNGRAGEAGVREFPPYNDEWEALYRKHIEMIKQGTLPDPVSICGTPHGCRRSLADV